MNERPILFSGPMVRAILDGRKTMTRRIVKPQPLALWDSVVQISTGRFGFQNADDPYFGGVHKKGCDYGKAGDRLWVRETWRVDGLSKGMALRMGYCATTQDNMSYRADMEDDRACDDCAWMPSIHMPRWASRITLEITAVRVERLQDINDGDAQHEGVECDEDYLARDIIWHVSSFERLWDSINGDRKDKHGNRLPYAWLDNPWVWVIEFKRVETNRGKA